MTKMSTARRSLKAHGRRILAGLCGAVVLIGVQAVRAEKPVELSIKVIYAQKGPAGVDPKLRGLVKDFKGLPFSSYSLADEATLALAKDEVGRVELPGKVWMTVVPKEGRSKKLRLEIEIKEYKIKTTVGIKPGATLAVGGPPYKSGTLILAITHLKP